MPEFKFAGQWHVQGGTDQSGCGAICPVEEKHLRVKVTVKMFIFAPSQFRMCSIMAKTVGPCHWKFTSLQH